MTTKDNTAESTLTKVYALESVFKRIKSWKYEKNTQNALIEDGYAEMPDSDIGCMRSFYHAENDTYAVLIVNAGDAKYLVLIGDIAAYISFLQQIGPCLHIFKHFVKHAG
ncbi:MAG TPA: hypothetical protein VGL94_18105 [Ktedonobacteraceae bacterium]|jgi:hypothetical protein